MGPSAKASSPIRTFAAFTLAAAALASSGTAAGAPGECILGWEGDGFGQGYVFLTGGWVARASTNSALPIRATASYLYYEFTENGGDVKVQAPGASLRGGVRWAGRTGYASVLAGGEVLRERRKPDVGAVRVVTRGGVVGQVEAALSAGRFQPQALAIYSGASEYLYGRGALRWQCNNLSWSGPTTWFAGLEGVLQGNSDVDAVQAGGVVECAFVRSRISLTVRGGGKWASTGDDRRSGGYVGLGLYRAF